MEYQAPGSLLSLSVALLFGSLFNSPAAALAQASCTATINYTWQREGGEPIAEGAEQLAASGKDEAIAKGNLQKVISRQTAQLLKSCRSLHEDASSCIAAKLTATGAVRSNLSFSSRKALEEAALSDCKKQQGSCKEVAATEPVCVVTQSSSSAADEKKDAKADKKKK